MPLILCSSLRCKHLHLLGAVCYQNTPAPGALHASTYVRHTHTHTPAHDAQHSFTKTTRANAHAPGCVLLCRWGRPSGTPLCVVPLPRPQGPPHYPRGAWVQPAVQVQPPAPLPCMLDPLHPSTPMPAWWSIRASSCASPVHGGPAKQPVCQHFGPSKHQRANQSSRVGPTKWTATMNHNSMSGTFSTQIPSSIIVATGTSVPHSCCCT